MRNILFLSSLFLCATACIYPYTPELDKAPEGVLAVDANISIGDVSSVLLSSLLSVWPDGQEIDPGIRPDRPDVRVWVEDDTGELYPGVPAPSSSGNYETGFLGNALFTIPTENAPADRSYRLCIEALGEKYVSDWTAVAAPPVIKEIGFSADDEIVTVHVSVDGGEEATGYLLLSYDETWEFHVDYAPRFSVTYVQETGQLNIEETYSDYSKYWCWKSSDNQLLYPLDYTAMSDSGITSWPITRFSRQDNRNHRRYCVNIKARTLSKETYRFLKNLENNTGGGDNLFTPSPGEIAGNLHCESNPERMVLGYVLFSKTTSKRAWLDSRYLRSSPLHTLYYPMPDKYMDFYRAGYFPLEELLPDEQEEGMGPYGWGPRNCFDCTAAGGTLKKPDFWDDEEL